MSWRPILSVYMGWLKIYGPERPTYFGERFVAAVDTPYIF